MSKPLNLKKIIVGSLVFPWYNLDAFIKALTYPLIIAVALEVGIPDMGENDLSFGYWIPFVLYLGTMSLFSVICHRLVLINPVEVSNEPTIRFGRREARFLFWLLVMVVLLMIISLPAIVVGSFAAWYSLGNTDTEISNVVLISAVIPAIYVTGRLMVIFPAIATEGSYSLKWAWTLTSGNGWRMALITGGLPIFVAIILGFFARENATLLEKVILSFLGTVIIAVEVVAVSLAYKEMLGTNRGE